MIIKWNAILFKKYFACQLWKNQCESPGKASLQYHTKHKDISSRFLRSEVKKPPLHPFRIIDLTTFSHHPNLTVPKVGIS